MITLAGATLIAPFFFLSGLGGELADRYDKALVAQRLKLAEIAVAAIAVAGFAFHSLTSLFFAVFLFGTIASLFGPIKYGILPDHLARSELTTGNALVEGGTFLAILLGTIVAGIAAKGGGDPIHFAWLMMVTSLACWVASRLIPPTGEGAPSLRVNRNIAASTIALIKYVWAEPRLWWGAMVASWFWLVGAIVLSLLPPLVTFRIGGSESVVTLFLTIFSVAVAVGSGLAAWLAAGRIVLLPTLVGAVLLGLFSLDLGWTASTIASAAHPIGIGEYLRLAATASTSPSISPASPSPAGCSSCRPSPRCRPGPAPTTAPASSPPSTCSMPPSWSSARCCSCRSCRSSAWTPPLFALIGVANLVVAVVIGLTMPTSWMNDLLSIVFRAFFRLEVTGLENVAKAGDNAIIALNHVSFLDPPLAMALLPKRPVFAIDVAMSKQWWIQPFLKFVRTMALDPLKPMALRTIINAVREGNMLVIFPEGRITITGSLMKIYDGAAMIADKSDAMVVPVRIDGPEKTIFSRLKNTQVRRRLFPKIKVTLLEPVKLNVDPEFKGKQAPAGRGSRALRHDVEPDVSHHADRPHRRRSDHRGGRDPRRQMAHHRGSAQRAA